MRRIAMAVTERETEHGAGAPLWRQGVHRPLNVYSRPVVSRACLDRRFSVRVVQIAATRFAAVMVHERSIGNPQQPTAHIINAG